MAEDFSSWRTIDVTGSGGEEDFSKWTTIDLGFTKPEPPKPGIVGEVGRGVMRGMEAVAYPLVEGTNIAVREGARAAGYPGVQQWAEQQQTRLAEKEQQAQTLDAPSVPGVTSIAGPGDAMRYAAGKVAEAIPMAAGYMVAGVPAMVAHGALAGGLHAAKTYGDDPGAIAVGAAVSGGAAAVPGVVLFGQAGRGVLPGAARGAAGMAAAGAGQAYAEPLAGVAAGQPYAPPSLANVADSAAAGALQGAFFGGVGGSRALHTPREEAPTVAPEHTAAMQEALGTLALPKPATTYGEGFTARDPAAFTPDPTAQLPAAPERQSITYNPNRTRGERFSVVQDDSPPARPSGGMNRGNLVDALEQQGHDRKELARAKIQDLRDRYDAAQPEPTRQEFRPSDDTSTHPVDIAAAEVKEPSPAQNEAGNFQKGHVRVQGLDISIETPKGGTRKGPIDEKTGEPAWQSVMPAHYGYVKQTVGGDGAQVDVHLGPRTKALFDGKPEEAAREPVFVVDQIDPKTGKFDEHKALLGFHTELEATRAYDESFTDGSGPSRRGAVTEKTFGDFKEWLKGDTTKPVTYKKPTVSDQLKVKREQQKQRMAFPELVSLVKRADAPARKPETKIEEAPESARSEIENQPQVYEHEVAGPTTVVREAGAEQKRSPLTTNKERILSDLESKVVNKLMTAAEADKEYGAKGGTRGRERKHPDFASYLKDRIEKAPAEEKRVLDQMTALQNNRALSAERRAAQGRELAAKLEPHSPERIEQLREALKEVEKPEASSAEDVARQERQNARLSKIQSLRKKKNDDVAGMTRSPAERSFQNERINQPLRDILTDTRTATAHEYFDRITSDPVIKFRLPHAAALARSLKRMLPPNLEALPNYIAAAKYPDRAEIYLRDDLHGMFDPKHDVIVLDPMTDRPLEAFLHEAMHAVTTFHLRDEAASVKSHQVLDAMARELEAYASKIDKADEPTFQSVLTNNEELHTRLMTDPVLQRVAASITPSQAFRAEMRELGYAPQESRSFWKTFTTWVRKVVGLPESSDTLLDHVLRPLQDITDTAHRYNLERFPASKDAPAEMRRETSDAAIAALPRLDRESFQKLARQADLGRKGDTLRKTLMTFAPSDQIVWWNKDILPGITKWREATEARNHEAVTFHDTHSEKVRGLLKTMGKLGPERDAVSRLMNEATIAEAHLGPGAKNDHLTKPDQMKTLQRLEGEYKALSSEGQKIYNGWRDYYRETHRIEREAELEAAVKLALPDATPAQLEALTQAVKTKRGINELIDNPDKSPVAAKFADAWDSNRAMVRLVAKVHSQGYVQGDYFPLRRFGDYVVHYGTKGTEDYGVEMFERKSEAEARRAELERDGLEPSQVLSKRDTKLREIVPTSVMDELNAAIRHREGFSPDQADAVRDMFAAIALQHASRSEAARTRLRRQGVKGASEQTERVLAADFLSLGYRLGYLKHGAAVTHAIGDMRRHARYLGDNGKPDEQIRAQAVINEIEKRQPATDDHSGELMGLTKNLTTFGFAKSLLSFSRVVTETMSAQAMNVSMIGARHGFGRSSLALAKALKEITPALSTTGAKNTFRAFGEGLKAADWNLSNLARDKLIAAGADRQAMLKLFNSANSAGLIDHSLTREMQRIARPGTDVTKGWWDRYLDFATYAGHAADVTNKASALKAAYDLEFTKTKSVDKSVKYAVDEILRNVQPNYNLHNKSRFSSGQKLLMGKDVPLMPVVTQFKQYGLHIYGVMANLTRASVHGATKQERREAQKALAGMIATHALLAGVEGSILADVLRYTMGAYDWATGAEKPHSYMNDVRSWITSMFGPQLGEVIAKGVPVMAGVDLHRRIGLADPLNVPQLRDFKKPGAYLEMVATAMTGAAGTDSADMATGMQHLLDGDFQKGLVSLAPRMVGDVLKAKTLSEKGVTDSKGGVVYPANKLSTGDVIAQGLGFQPEIVSEVREKHNAKLEAREEPKYERGKLMQQFVNGNPGERNSVMPQIQAFNRAHPDNAISYTQLLQALQREKKQEKDLGLQIPKKSAARLREAGAFANVP